MTHLDKEWVVEAGEPPLLGTAGNNGWWIAEAIGGLPGDPDGVKAMEHICELHNTWLASKGVYAEDEPKKEV